MQLKTFSLVTLGLIFLSQWGVQAADDTDLTEGQEFSDSYLSAFGQEEQEPDFELSDEIAPSHHFEKRGPSCSKQHTAKGSDTCISISKKYGISLSTFYSLNSRVNKSCTNVITGKKYCVKKSSSGKKKKTSSKKKTTKKKSSKKSGKKSGKKTTKKSGKKESRKKLQTKSAFTYYWIAQPDDYKSGGGNVAVKTCSGKKIASVSSHYADALVMEGTGVVGSKIVNLGGCTCSNYKCFELVNRKDDPYGLTSYDSPLRPYVTIASNDIKRNTKIYVPSLAGWKIPGTNKKHNGCLLVDDQSWSFSGKHIDFYVYSMSNYQKLDKAHSVNKVDIYEGGSCKLLNYMS